jgi:hypothetical protein
MEDRFDLKSLIPPSAGVVHPKKVFSAGEKSNLLDGYELVPPNLWVKIPKKTHIRYETVEGAFRRGGFVSHHWMSKDGKQFTQLVFDKYKRADDGTNPSWSICHDKTSRIWKKISFDKQCDQQGQSPNVNQSQFVNDMKIMASEIKRLQQRVSQLELNQKKLVKVIKQLP